MMLKAPFRPAEKEDCYRIAELVQMSSAGVADYIWSTLGIPDLSLLEIGEQRLARENTDLSYRNCIVAEVDGDVAGLLLSFPEENAVTDYGTPPDPGASAPDVLAPYRELASPGSYHICEMALLPQYQSQGLGGRFLEIAKNLAREHGCPHLSLVVFEQNVGAVRLYERQGFKTIGRHPVAPHPLIRYTGDILLMTASVAVGAAAR